MTTVADMLAAQLRLQVESFNADPTKMSDEERCEFIRWNVLALTDELHEMLNEVGWKPWASSKHVNGEPAMKEMVDAWHFFMNILLAISQDEVEITETRFVGEYMKKVAVNAQRQADGYDGVEGKCPECHRDVTDAENYEWRDFGEGNRKYCVCGADLGA